MARRFGGVALVVAMLVTLAGPGAAQTTGFVVESIDNEGYPDVALTVTVENQLLEEVDPVFRIIEEGVEREVTVAATTSDDLQVVLLLDVSGSMVGEPLAAAQAAAIQFIEEMPAGVEIAIVAFGNAPALASEFTNDKVTLITAVELLTTGGQTALYDGVVSAASLLGAEVEAGRTMILLSDGGDTVSNFSLSEAVASLRDLQAEFFAVELQSPENDRAALDALASAAGGTVVAADDPAALSATFGDIASELLSSYRLVYSSESYDIATLNIVVLVNQVIIASETQIVELPPNPNLNVPAPEPPPLEPEPLPEPRPGRFIELTWLQRETAEWLGIGAIFLAAATILTILVLQPRARRSRRGTSTLTASPEQRALTRKRTALTVIAESATSLANQTLVRGDRMARLNLALERAGMALRPGEFIVMVVSAVLAFTAAGLIVAGPLVGLALGAVVLLVVPTWLSSRARQRSALFNDQLGDTLQLMSASLRAGYGLMQAVDAVAEEAPSPTTEEFARIKIETHLGRDLDDALQATAERVDSEDFRWVAEAIEIHRQIGGDLAEILDAVNETIRDRNRIRRRITALSAEGRISAVILSLIPIVMAIFIVFVNPDYMGELTQTGVGQVLILVGIIAWIGAVFWMRRIVRLIF